MADLTVPELSEREIELLNLLVTGATNQQIGYKLHISVNTVKTHLRNIFGKLGVESRTEATTFAIQHNLVRVTAGAANVAPSVPAALPLPELLPPSAFVRAPHWLVLSTLALVLAAVLGVFLWPLQNAPQAAAANPFVDATAAQGVALPSGTSGRWHREAALATARARFAQVTVGQTVLVIGGLTADGWSASVEAYDAETGRWERRADKPTAAANIAAVEVDGLVYVPGGLDAASSALTVHEVYDPAEDSWRSLAPLPRPVCAYAVAAYPGGYYVLGGWDGASYLATVYRYDIARDAWFEEPPLTSARGFAAAAFDGSLVYLAGGFDGRRVLDLVESYDPVLAEADIHPWTSLAPLQSARAGLGLVSLNGSLFAVGGGWLRPVSTSERYDIAGNIWSSFDSPLSGGWRSLGLSVLELKSGSYLAAVGGWNDGYLATTWFYQAMYRVFVP